MLHIILVEAALETVPPEIRRHPSVRRNAKRRGKQPLETLLNRSLHHSAMSKLKDSHKRGRPDITHICLLEALGTPLNREGKLRIWVHTYGDYVIEISPTVRLPRDCNRFNSLMEQLFKEGRIPPREGEQLMTINKLELRELLEGLGSTRTVALTSHGKPSSLENLCNTLSREESPTILLGAFPKGPMSDVTLSLADDVVSIYPQALEVWVVISRLVYQFERALSL